MPNNVKTYDGTRDLEDHVKIFQAEAQMERWVMPTWCHMFNSTLIGDARVWFDELPAESIDGYKDLKAAFLAYFMQQKKYVETGRMKGAPKCMRISEFMHGVNNPELTKRLNEHVPKTMDEMMIATTAFIHREAAATGKKKGHAFTPFTRTPKEILATEAGKFKPPPPMVTPVEKRSSNKFCDFHNDKGHSTNECMQLKKQIEELVRAGKLSHLIKEIKQGRDQPKAGKKEVPTKDKSMEIYVIQPWHRVTRQKVTQSFKRVSEITFPSLTTSSGTKGPLVIEAEIGGHIIHRMYVDGGYSMEVLYEHCFNRLRPEIKSQMVPTTTSLTGFSGEAIWLLGQLRLLVTIGDADHSTKAWMNFMTVRSLSPYNGIIGRPGIREIQAVPSTAHEMLKFPADGRILTIRSTILIHAECATVTTSSKEMPKEAGVQHENFKPSDMTGVPRSVAEHRFNIREGYSLVRQKKKGPGPGTCEGYPSGGTKASRGGNYARSLLPRLAVQSSHGEKTRRFHQILMAESNEEKTAFHTSQGVYCYTKMPFGLKNVGATYQRLVDKAFDSQVGRNIEVYIDDLVIKSHTEAEMLTDIDETFRTLRKINMKLNPKKCTFGAMKGMFLGYMITLEGIKPCPNKTEALLQLPSPWIIKEVQSLNGKLASLNRFFSKSAEKSLPLFKILKKCIKKSDFHWTPEAEQAFKQLKQHLSELPLLVAPKPKEELIVYLSASPGAISAVLMTERGAVQTPVYFISCALQGPELNYTLMEKLVLSLVFAAKRLRSITLGEHNITYRPRTSVKGQILADFLVEKLDESPSDTPMVEVPSEGTKFTYALRFQFTASNNKAEYTVLIAGLRITTQMGVRNVHVSIDFKLVANQVLGTYVAKEENTVKYLEKTKSLISGFANFSISQVPRSKNKKADALSKIASTSFAHLSKQVLVEILKEKSIQEGEVVTVVEEEGPTWMTPIVEYLKDGTLPGDRNEASKLRIKGRYMHAGPRSVVAKAMQLGYYWPTMHRDARDMIYTCNDCQIHHLVPRNPHQPLTPITAPWPFYKWGIDIAGPFPEGPGKVKFLIVAMDYFTKWIESKSVATITGNQVKKFMWDNIVCRFGLPGEIVSDNVKHLQTNGLVERVNRSLGEGIKARLGEGNKNWIEELPNVLWVHRTMIKSSHGDTPFSLTYGTEAVIPAEIGMPTYRTAVVDATHNNEELRLNLDLLEERRERAAIREAKAKSKMTKHYNVRVRGVTFRPGDFVYRDNDASHAVDGGKLGPKWEGPYEVMEVLGDGAYKLRSTDGTVFPRMWNIANLKKCYL
ncbi:reverse transcriptase domain-containing protein [Tanacetum coccineum]